MNAKPIIAWKNQVLKAALSVSTEASGFPPENLQDWRPYLAWKGTGSDEQWLKLDAGAGATITAACLGLSGHDLKSQGVTNLALKYSDNDVDWFDCLTPWTPATDKGILKTFPAQTHRYFKLVIPTGYTAPPRLGVWFLGEYLPFPVYPELGFDPDGQAKESEAQLSRGGNLLGVVERFTRREIRVAFRHLSPAWCETAWKPFFAEHGLRPFFWAWDLQNHSEQVYLLRLLKPELAMPYEAGSWRSLDLTLEGLAE
jgi:hypothetical protein